MTFHLCLTLTCNRIFILSFLVWGQRKSLQVNLVRWLGWPPCSCIVKKKKKTTGKSFSFNRIIGNLESIWVKITFQKVKFNQMMVFKWPLTIVHKGQYVFPIHVYSKIFKSQFCKNYWRLVYEGSYDTNVIYTKKQIIYQCKSKNMILDLCCKLFIYSNKLSTEAPGLITTIFQTLEFKRMKVC